jgi:hypothetical protein
MNVRSRLKGFEMEEHLKTGIPKTEAIQLLRKILDHTHEMQVQD